MRLDTLRIKGVLAFDGDVCLDFKELPPGLIALVGPNGHGKSTIMESPIAATHRTYPSREKAIFEYAHGTDSFIESTFELEGRGLYRARLNLDRLHRKQEGTILQLGAGGPRILNDGKVSTYDAVVAELLPPLPDLLASVLAVQTKKGSFSAQERKERRVLFGSLLGLDHLEASAERARQAADRVMVAVLNLTAERDALARLISDDEETAIEQAAQRLQVDGGTAEARREELRRTINTVDAMLSSLSADALRHAAARERFDRLEAEQLAKTVERDNALGFIAHTQRELAEERNRRERALAAWLDRNAAEQHDESGYRGEIAAITSARDASLGAAESKIAANKDLLARADVIRASSANVGVLEDSVAKAKTTLDGLRRALDAHRSRERDLVAALAAIAVAQTELTQAEADVAKLSSVPFGEDCAPCRFMTDAAEAKARIPELQQVIGAKDRYTADLASVRQLLERDKTSVASWTERVTRLDAELAAEKVIAAELPHLTAAEERIKTRTQQIADAHARFAADTERAADRERERVARLQREAEQRKTEHVGELAALNTRAADTIARETQHVAALEAEIADAITRRDAAGVVGRETRDAARQAEECAAQIATYRRELEGVTARIATIHAQADELRRRAAAFDANRTTCARLDARLTELRTEAVEWKVLAGAFGRDGLQTLEIDNAGPAVSAFTNDLLRSCFGGRFSVELVTQVAKKGKDGTKEVFELTVYDNHRGGEARDISDLSGGQRVIVEEAFRSAIALLVNTRNQHPMRTAWRDESTAALYHEVLPDYIAMLRRTQEIGGFHQIFFATHSLDCARLADAQIFVANGGYTLLYPPYAPEPEPVAEYVPV